MINSFVQKPEVRAGFPGPFKGWWTGWQSSGKRPPTCPLLTGAQPCELFSGSTEAGVQVFCHPLAEFENTQVVLARTALPHERGGCPTAMVTHSLKQAHVRAEATCLVPGSRNLC